MTLTETPPVTIGMNAPLFSLPGTDGQTYSLNNFTGEVLVVVFTCNHCPYAQAIWPRMIALANELKNEPIDFVAINSNDAVGYPDDSFENMQAKAGEWGIPFPYLHDESQEIAKTYGAVCTPDFFVFDNHHQLKYRGRFDDSWQHPNKVKQHELKNAIFRIRAGGIPENQNPSMGCNIKWK